MFVTQESREGLYRYTLDTKQSTHRAWLRYVFTKGRGILEIDRYLAWNDKEIKNIEELEKLLATEQDRRIEEKGDPDYIAIGGYLYRRKHERFVVKTPAYLERSDWAPVRNKKFGKGWAHLTKGQRIVYYF